MAFRKPSDLRGWTKVVFRHRKKIFFPTVLVMITVLWASVLIPREYSAEAKFERSTGAVMNAAQNQVVSTAIERTRAQIREDLYGRPAIEELLTTLQQQMPGKFVFARTADGQSYTPEAEARRWELIRILRSNIGLYSQNQSRTTDQYVLVFKDADPELAPRVANLLMENYIRKVTRRLEDELVAATTTFKDEMTRYKNRVISLEQRKISFQRDNPDLTDPDDPNSLSLRLKELRTRLEMASDELARLKEVRTARQQWHDDQPAQIKQDEMIANPERQQMVEQRRNLENELEHRTVVLLQTDQHPQVIRLKERLAQFQAAIAQMEAQTAGNTIYLPNQAKVEAAKQIAEITGQINALEKLTRELQAQVDAHEHLVRNFFEKRNQLREIEGDLEEAQQQLTFWEDNARRTTIALRAGINEQGIRVRVIQRAEQSPRPAKPTLMMILMAALVAGGAVGVGLAVLSELLDRSYHDVEHAVDELKLPVLGATNEIVTPAISLRRRIMAWGVYPLSALLLLLVLIASFFVIKMSLENPASYYQLMKEPAVFVERVLGR